MKEIILGAIMPFIVDLVGKYVKSPRGRFWLAIGISTLTAGIAAVLECLYQVCSLTGQDFFADVAIIFGMSQVIYKQFWEMSVPREAYLNLLGDRIRALAIKRERLNLP